MLEVTSQPQGHERVMFRVSSTPRPVVIVWPACDYKRGLEFVNQTVEGFKASKNTSFIKYARKAYYDMLGFPSTMTEQHTRMANHAVSSSVYEEQ